MRVERNPQAIEITHSEERVFLPGRKNPVILKRNSTALFLLQRVRDEAHRFAITYHRQLRTKERLRSALDSIPGIGGTRRKRLLRHFGTNQYEWIFEIQTIPWRRRQPASDHPSSTN